MTATHTRVVVADQSEARFYDAGGASAHDMHLVHRMTDPAAHLHDRDMVSDKPGRVFDRAPPATGRRGAVGHHGTAGERSPRKHEAESFARAIVAELEKARTLGQFEQLVLVAGPGFLGLLRECLPKELLHVVAAQVGKDLVHQSDSAIMTHIPWTDLQ